jgi:hemolysin D
MQMSSSSLAPGGESVGVRGYEMKMALSLGRYLMIWREAQVENKDVGFVKEGQDVEIKVETFPFTLYGTIPGQVVSVSDDAVPIDKDTAGTLVYLSRISMDRATIDVQGKPVHLSPGMAVTVEIKTGQRRIIEYLLSPLMKSVKESLRER